MTIDLAGLDADASVRTVRCLREWRGLVEEAAADDLCVLVEGSCLVDDLAIERLVRCLALPAERVPRIAVLGDAPSPHDLLSWLADGFGFLALADRAVRWRPSSGSADSWSAMVLELLRGAEEWVEVPFVVPARRRKPSLGGLGSAQVVDLVVGALELDMLDVGNWQGNGERVTELLIMSVIRRPELCRREMAEMLTSLPEPLVRLLGGSLPRFEGVFDALRRGDVTELEQQLRLRVVVAGHDLKFIDFIYDYLPPTVEIREDRWSTEKRHDVQFSLDSTEWADVVWVEWLAHCAVWYSKHKRAHQVLIVRQHRYELTRDVGYQVDYDAVDALIVIAVHTLEAVAEKFGVPRTKLRVIPNIYESSRYVAADQNDTDRQYNLALVGAVPRLKGLHRAIEIVETLRDMDPRYTLSIFGRRPSELPWIAGDPDERAYYDACDNYLRDKGLETAVIWRGWANIREELGNYGYVLSTSDLEGSHVSPGEAYLVGSIGVFLRWRGVEYVYPATFGFSSPAEIARYISESPVLDPVVQNEVRTTASWLESEQGVGAFLSSVGGIVLEAPL